MRTLGWLMLAAIAFAAGCGGERDSQPAGDGALVLEVGGGKPSLRQALKRAGLDAPPPIDLSPPAAAAPPPVADDAPAAKAAPPATRAAGGDAPKPQAPPAPTPAPEPAVVVVTLAEGQTLIHLARKHLGDGNRFREILELNGWSEAESRRLKPGTKVKIPKAGAARSGGR